MCSICHQHLCDTRCPNAPESVPVEICNDCGCEIYEGDKFYNGNDSTICKDCMEDMTVEEILQLLGESLAVA